MYAKTAMGIKNIANVQSLGKPKYFLMTSLTTPKTIKAIIK